MICWMIPAMVAMTSLSWSVHAEDAWNVPEEHVSDTFGRYVNEEWEEAKDAPLLDLTEGQVLDLVPRYAHLVNAVSPIPGSRSRSWVYDPLKDPDHI